ncbi:hypothetical protein ACT17_09765 [Mycolicibacterium conceptionense]|jgi:hypothetical protein|uniref:DUF4190 domain-containing protein n=2 Tax=Mycolicibacterium TaxID=1866885 RepID=A0ABR5FRT6_9MYCO|nr:MULTISPECIES: DUF4190 domain-containing protein [Mycolicibacterium]KLI08080.1 hypothetical protein AA982_11235 [Mycolicibacterium senegalense]KLO50525.1 hypothetical protein ABW05_02390 [Mycolicibacterium senegalense]KMV18693.1 hypothetical protein ACT17_09765 [Mycolicibacterium conceptionense]OBJ94126.1 DUF4190 domain-containing protein [Mycolicibacterium conceptionense]OMB78079.1 DUF4190 domain-containing protein [Mycolicibacterium conceptionense]
MTDERSTPPGSDDEPQQAGAPPPPTYPYGPPPGAYPGPYPPAPPYGAYPMQPAPRAPANGLGIAALVIAILALLLTWSVIGGVIFGVTAVILGFLAHGRYRRGEATNGGVAVTGIALGAVACVLSLVFIGIWVYFGQRWFDEVGGREYMHCLQQAGDDTAAQQRCENEFERRVEDSFGVTPTPSR